MNVSCTLRIAVVFALLAGMAAGGIPARADEGFDRYAIILSKKPFGVPPAPPPEPTPAPAPSSPAMESELRVCALTDWPGRGIKASVVENKTNKSYTLGVGETIDGLTLVSASIEKEEVLLQRGAETAVMKLAAGKAAGKPAAARPSARPTRNATSSKRIEDRRRELLNRRREQVKREPVKPRYTGEELQRHLREYNMEAIRQGYPALPIELTPEQDDQLVAEGLLPPSGDSFSSANDPLLLEAVEKELREQGGNLPPGF